MKNLKEISKNLYQEPAQVEAKKQSLKAAEKKIDDLFLDLASIFVSFKPSVSELKRIKAQWLAGLGENKITPAMLPLGLERARASEKPYLPTVGEFCGWCKPRLSDYGMSPEDLLDQVIAFKSAQKFGDASANPLIVAICMDLDYGQVKMMRREQAEKILEKKALDLLSGGFNPENVCDANAKIEANPAPRPAIEYLPQGTRAAKVLERMKKIRQQTKGFKK